MITNNDVVLIYVEKKPVFYARVEEIYPDVKPGWWQVKLLILTFPLQVFTWILDEFQLDGADFTMGGTPILLEPVVCPATEDVSLQEEEKRESPQNQRQEKEKSKIISLADRKKK